MKASIRHRPQTAGRSRLSTSITEAREARAQIEEKFDRAVASSSGNRLRRSEQTALLLAAYLAIRKWRNEHQAERIEEMLRRAARGWIAPNSGLELVLLRSAIPELDPKRASKWAAAIEFAAEAGIPRKRFVAFLRRSGGIEGAARKMARVKSRSA